jgi:hypothetical protein
VPLGSRQRVELNAPDHERVGRLLEAEPFKPRLARCPLASTISPAQDKEEPM